LSTTTCPFTGAFVLLAPADFLLLADEVGPELLWEEFALLRNSRHFFNFNILTDLNKYRKKN
jgi:hypothetical protein